MESALLILALVLAAAAGAGLSGRLGLSAPLVLVVAGVAASFVPGVPAVELDPHLILVGVLPPLLYAAAIRTSLVDIAATRDALVLLAVVLVGVTTVAVGLTAWWVLPGLPLAAALALGAVVAPPDAVAATAVARTVGMPRRIITILEGESLVNDAAALVALTSASAAITATVTPLDVVGGFAWAAGGGIAVGLVVTALLTRVRHRIDDPVLDTTLSLTAPFVAFLPAEAIHASGVLAVVVTGLLLGHRAVRLQSAASRLSETVNWRTVQFVLENVVFLLIGLQVRPVLRGVADTDLSAPRIAAVCAAVVAAAILVRIVYVMAAVGAYRVGTVRMRRAAWSWRAGAVVSWAGMRGVVTLAAAFLLPEETPQREVLQLAALSVVAGTLLVQGTTLPWLVRRLGLRGPSAAEDALQSAALITAASRAGLARLEEARTSADPEAVVAQLRARADLRINGAWERLGRSQDEQEPPAAAYRRLRLTMLEAEREVIVHARDSGRFDDEVLRAAMTAVDVEESVLDRVQDAGAPAAQDRAGRRHDPCAHLAGAPAAVTPRTPGVCEDCVREGTEWVHLRVCLACGHVGCCDSSVGRHATAHFRATGHPVVRSAEPGEEWRWCYEDSVAG